MASSPNHFLAKRWENSGSSGWLYFGGLQNHCTYWLHPWDCKESYSQTRQHIKKQRHHFVNKCLLVKSMVFPVVMYAWERWNINKAEWRRIDALEKFFWNSLAFSMIQRMLAIWSLVPLPFLKPVWTSGSSRFMYCWRIVGEFWEWWQEYTEELYCTKRTSWPR